METHDIINNRHDLVKEIIASYQKHCGPKKLFCNSYPLISRRINAIKCHLVLLLLWLPGVVKAQTPVKSFSADSFTESEYAIIKKMAGTNMLIPLHYEKPILIALTYFPELANLHIEFRINYSHSPLASRPSWTSLFKKHRDREYIITISDSSVPSLTPILFKNLDFNAQVGVIGHELSHIVDFSSKGALSLLRIGAGNFSPRFLDRFEFKTDSICIAHGMGYQLLSWSVFVKKALKENNWEGADNINDPVMKRERYMNPETIRSYMKRMKIYQ